jgi:hypothetical protein
MKYAINARAGAFPLGAMMMAAAGVAAAADPGVGVGAPGPGVRPGVGAPGPGLNQPGVAGNVGGVARRSVRR